MSDRSEQLESILREDSHSGDSRLGFGDAAPQPEDGPSSVIGRVAGARVPVSGANFHAFLSPDAKWLAMPLLDGSTTSLWALRVRAMSGGDGWTSASGTS